MSLELGNSFQVLSGIALAEYLIESPAISAEETTIIIDDTPMGQNKSPEELRNAYKKAFAANIPLAKIRATALDSLADIFEFPDLLAEDAHKGIDKLAGWIERHQSPETALHLSVSLVDLYLLKDADKLAPTFSCDKSTFLLAASQAGAEIAGVLGQRLSQEGLKEVCRAYLLYYTAVQVAVLGIRTGASYFTHSPDEIDLSILKSVGVHIDVGGPEELKRTQARLLFEGTEVSPIREVNGHPFITAGPIPPAEDSTEEE